MITCRQRGVEHLLGVQEAVLEHCAYLQTRRLHVNTIVKEVATELPPLLFLTGQHFPSDQCFKSVYGSFFLDIATT